MENGKTIINSQGSTMVTAHGETSIEISINNKKTSVDVSNEKVEINTDVLFAEVNTVEINGNPCLKIEGNPKIYSNCVQNEEHVKADHKSKVICADNWYRNLSIWQSILVSFVIAMLLVAVAIALFLLVHLAFTNIYPFAFLAALGAIIDALAYAVRTARDPEENRQQRIIVAKWMELAAVAWIASATVATAIGLG